MGKEYLESIREDMFLKLQSPYDSIIKIFEESKCIPHPIVEKDDLERITKVRFEKVLRAVALAIGAYFIEYNNLINCDFTLEIPGTGQKKSQECSFQISYRLNS